MKIALFGASGKTGIEVLKQSLENGYEVNSFVRDSAKLSSISNSNNKIFVGDVLDASSFGEVLSGVDVVVVTLSGIVTEGIKNILSEMNTKNVNKIILMSSYPMSGNVEGMNYLKSAGMDESKINEVMPMIIDKQDQEKVIVESRLDWIIVRPTFLKDGPKTGKYQIHTDNVQFLASDNYINRSDVADFIVRVLESSQWNKKIVSVSS